jgi:hypothetical protein
MTPQKIQSILIEINSSLDKNSNKFGKLLTWHDHRFGDNTNYYGIGLSDSLIFDTGKAFRRIDKNDSEMITNFESGQYSPEQTIDRLNFSVFCFQDWQYHQYTWNAEQLARLVISNDLVSFETIKKLGLAMTDMMWKTINGRNRSAKEVFENFLKANNAGHLIKYKT